MKKLLLLSWLCLGMWGANAQTCGTTITSFPYLENFDGTTPNGWVSGGTNSSWTSGKPAKSIINTAFSGTKSWVTSLTGNHNANEQSFVESPCFNLSSVTLPVVELKIWWNCEFSNDGAVLQSSIDGGTTWQVVGAFGDPNNWYTDNTINSGPGGQAAATAVGWTGRNSTNNGSGGWVTAKHVLTGLGGQTSVKLRIAFGSDNAGSDQGIAFDNFSVYEHPVNDAGITSIPSLVSPVVPNTPLPVTAIVKNFGTAALANASIGWSVNNVAQPNFAYTAATPLAINTASAPVQIGTFTFPTGVHKVKVWAKLPNGAADQYAANDTSSVTFNACNALSGNYTINKNVPASATSFTSFGALAQMLGSCGVSGPVTITVAPNSGPYLEMVTFTNIPGVSATNTITFNGNGNSISEIPTLATDAILKLNGAQFMRFNNLRIENQSTNASSALQLINNASNNIFTSCIIDHNLSSTATAAGINIGSGSNTNKFLNNKINAGYYGVYANGVTATLLTGNQFIGNIIKDANNSGFNISYTNNTLIEGNDISRPNRVAVFAFYGVYLSSGAINTVVSKNQIHNTHDAAAPVSGAVTGIYSIGAATVGNENIIVNNLIYNINNPGNAVTGLYNAGGNGTFYYHNTVALDPNTTYTTLRAMHFGSSATNVKVINNIFSVPSPASNKQGILIFSPSTIVSNNNDFYIGTTGNIGSYDGVNKPTLADWKTVNGNAYDQNSLDVDPVFATSSFLKPVNGALNNAGQAVAAVTEDFAGAPRNPSTPDMGAYEFTPSVNDAGITAITAPTTPVVPGSQAVIVTLKNYGTATLTSATIGWSVNGLAQPTYNLTGSNLTSFQTSAGINIGNYNFSTGAYTIKVWSKLPNGLADGLAANDTSILRIISCGPLAGNYTINKNNPTAGTNFHSIAEATQRLNSCGVSAPVTFTVTAGTGPYNEQVLLGNIPNSSATNTVTFEGSGNSVIAFPGQKPGIVVLDGAKYVKLNNFVLILDANATVGWGVQLINAADYNTISNNTINLPINTPSNLVNGIVAGSAIATPGINTSYTKIQNNTINGGHSGIQINGNTGGLNAVNNEITGNQLNDQMAIGIYLNQANGTLVESNDISRATRTNGGTYYHIYLLNTTMKTIVSKNKMHDVNNMSTLKTGLVYGIFTGAAATVGNENIIKNNIIYNLNGTNGSFYAFYNNGANGTWYYNNSVAVDAAVPYDILRGLVMQNASTNVKFINNIISFPGTATAKHAIHLTAAATPLISNNNDLYIGTSGNIGFNAGTNQATLADWKAVNTNAFDQNSVSVDPVFINAAAGNLKPNSVLIDNLGQSLTAVTDDILGVARHVTTPDIGAYEFDVVTTDVGITSVSAPTATGCGITSTETITVTIKNFGANPQPAVPVTFSVNGIPMAATPETYNASPLAPYASATYSFTAKANLAASGHYQIIVKTQLTGDQLTSNDADTITITNPLVSTLPVNFNFETAAAGLPFFRKDIRSKSNIVEHVIASAPLVTTSTKGMVMDGITNSAWIAPAGLTDPWTNNSDNFAGAYLCVIPTGGSVTDSLWLTFDMKQLFKGANTSTNFRVTVNGTQVGPTYRPPFDPTLPSTPNNWRHIKVNLYAYRNLPTILIGLESSVKEEFANGNGTANLIDNVTIVRRLVTNTGVKDSGLVSRISVFPNPSKGLFNVDLPANKTFTLEITDLTGKVIQRQETVGKTELKLENQAKGIYLLKVSGENGSAVRKLVVE